MTTNSQYSIETLTERRELDLCSTIYERLEMLEQTSLSPKISVAVKERKSFHNKNRLKEFMSSKPGLPKADMGREAWL